MSRVWIVPMIVLVVRTVGSQQGCPPAQLPDAQPPIFSSRAELIVVDAAEGDSKQ